MRRFRAVGCTSVSLKEASFFVVYLLATLVTRNLKSPFACWEIHDGVAENIK